MVNHGYPWLQISNKYVPYSAVSFDLSMKSAWNLGDIFQIWYSKKGDDRGCGLVVGGDSMHARHKSDTRQVPDMRQVHAARQVNATRQVPDIRQASGGGKYPAKILKKRFWCDLEQWFIFWVTRAATLNDGKLQKTCFAKEEIPTHITKSVSQAAAFSYIKARWGAVGG